MASHQASHYLFLAVETGDRSRGDPFVEVAAVLATTKLELVAQLAVPAADAEAGLLELLDRHRVGPVVVAGEDAHGILARLGADRPALATRLGRRVLDAGSLRELGALVSLPLSDTAPPARPLDQAHATLEEVRAMRDETLRRMIATSGPEADAIRLFHGSMYLRHNCRRQEHLATLGLDFRGRTVLEVGAGVGDHTTYFLDRECRVLSVEPRPENVALYAKSMEAMARAGFEGAKGASIAECDAESLDRLPPMTFDVVYAYGLLYHVEDPAVVIAAMGRRCRELLVLETCVSPGESEAIHPIEEKKDPTQAFHVTGCRPTRPWIVRCLKEHFAHVYVTKTQPCHPEFPTDWGALPVPREGVPSEDRLTRAVFVAARVPLNNDRLTTEIPMKQPRCA